MKCRVIRGDSREVTAIVCGSIPSAPKHCHECGEKAYFLCDAPRYKHATVATCDRPMCLKHSRRQSVGVDYCEEHAEQKAER